MGGAALLLPICRAFVVVVAGLPLRNGWPVRTLCTNSPTKIENTAFGIWSATIRRAPSGALMAHARTLDQLFVPSPLGSRWRGGGGRFLTLCPSERKAAEGALGHVSARGKGRTRGAGPKRIYHSSR